MKLEPVTKLDKKKTVHDFYTTKPLFQTNNRI